MYVGCYLCVCAHVHTCAHGSPKLILVSSFLVLYFITEAGLLISPALADSATLAGQLDPEIPPLLLIITDYRGLPCSFSFCRGVGDINSRPHVSVANTLSTEPSP